jgi:hypothetical protein
MSLRVEWFRQAQADLLGLPDWRLAEKVDAAVMRYAQDGIGFVLRVHDPKGSPEYRLLIPGTRTFVRIRSHEGTLYIERVIHRA